MYKIALWCIGLSYFSTHAQDGRTRNFPNQIEYPTRLDNEKQVWIFIMAGQSNMAGRGLVEPQDTIPHPDILSMNRSGELIVAKEPLHFYEPNLTGLDCGLSFGKQLIKSVNKSITILLVPTAVGGSSSNQWLGDSLHRNVRLLSNFRDRVAIAKKYGTIKGILWHQGESDTKPDLIPGYEVRLQKLFSELRLACGDATIPILMGELGTYSNNPIHWNLINEAIHRYAAIDKNAFVISTEDLKPKEDFIHFDSEGQRTMGERMAKKFLAVSHR